MLVSRINGRFKFKHIDDMLHPCAREFYRVNPNGSKDEVLWSRDKVSASSPPQGRDATS